MGNQRSTRRRFLQAVGVLGVTGLAGCTETLEEKTATPPEVDSPSEVEPLEEDTATPAETTAVDEEKLTAEGHPNITLNWAYHYSDVLPIDVSLSSVDQEDVPQHALDLSIVSAVRNSSRGTYYEEYQTAYAAEKRLDLEVGDQFEGAHTKRPVKLIMREDIDGYPNDWFVFENELNIHALSRAEGIIAGGFVSKDKYMNPIATVLEQLQTGQQPEGGGLKQPPFELLDVFEDRYGHTQLDLEKNAAASVPMEDFSRETATALVEDWYDDSWYESGSFQITEIEVDGYPVDSHEAYRVVSNTFDTSFSVEVASWHSIEFATKYAEESMDSTKWTFEPDEVAEDTGGENLGPYDGTNGYREQFPNCGFIEEDGVQKLRRWDESGGEYHPRYDVYSGNVTMRV